MTINTSVSQQMDEPVVAVKPYTGGTSLSPSTFDARVDSGTSNRLHLREQYLDSLRQKPARAISTAPTTAAANTTRAPAPRRTPTNGILQEIRDTNGNYIKYTYTRDNNEIYPYQIIYTGNGATDGLQSSRFATSTRPDARISFAPASRVTTNYRISEIDASFNGSSRSQISARLRLGHQRQSLAAYEPPAAGL